MKYSDDSEDHRKANIGYASERWRQLYGLQNDWGTEGIKFIFLVNSGAAVALLAFLGSVANARDLRWPKVSLGFFVLGIVLIGLLHALRHYRISKLFKKWRESVNEYYTEQKDWGQIIGEDKKRSEQFDWALLMAYLAFACFITGIVIGMFNFSDLTSGEKMAEKKPTSPVPAPAHKPTVPQQPTTTRDSVKGGAIRVAPSSPPPAPTPRKK